MSFSIDCARAKWNKTAIHYGRILALCERRHLWHGELSDTGLKIDLSFMEDYYCSTLIRSLSVSSWLLFSLCFIFAVHRPPLLHHLLWLPRVVGGHVLPARCVSTEIRSHCGSHYVASLRFRLNHLYAVKRMRTLEISNAVMERSE